MVGLERALEMRARPPRHRDRVCRVESSTQQPLCSTSTSWKLLWLHVLTFQWLGLILKRNPDIIGLEEQCSSVRVEGVTGMEDSERGLWGMEHSSPEHDSMPRNATPRCAVLVSCARYPGSPAQDLHACNYAIDHAVDPNYFQRLEYSSRPTHLLT